MLEKQKISIDNQYSAGRVSINLSDAFETINHRPLLAKLHGYGFSKWVLAMMSSYLSNWKQRMKINDIFSSSKDSIFGVPQWSVLGSLLINI